MDTLLVAGRLAPAREMDSEPWLAAARAGEPWALERFYTAYQPSVYALSYRLLARAADAEDATQTTFIRAFRELPRFRGGSALRTWVFKITLNESLTLLRKRKRTGEWTEAGEPYVRHDLQSLETLAVQGAMARLAPDQRAILVLRFWEGLSYEEMAHVLGISLTAARMRLKRARDQFRREYAGDSRAAVGEE